MSVVPRCQTKPNARKRKGRSAPGFAVKRAVIKSWRVFFWSNQPQKALTCFIIRFVSGPPLRPWRRSGRRQGLGEHAGHQPAGHSGRNDSVHDPVDLARDDDGPTDADLLASARISATVCSATASGEYAGTRTTAMPRLSAAIRSTLL
jgi:hypothetical protein